MSLDACPQEILDSSFTSGIPVHTLLEHLQSIFYFPYAQPQHVLLRMISCSTHCTVISTARSGVLTPESAA